MLKKLQVLFLIIHCHILGNKLDREKDYKKRLQIWYKINDLHLKISKLEHK